MASREFAARPFSLMEHTMQKAIPLVALLALALTGCMPKKIPGTTNESKGVCRSRTVGTPSVPAAKAIPPPTAESALNR